MAVAVLLRRRAEGVREVWELGAARKALAAEVMQLEKSRRKIVKKVGGSWEVGGCVGARGSRGGGASGWSTVKAAPYPHGTSVLMPKPLLLHFLPPPCPLTGGDAPAAAGGRGRRPVRR